MLGVCTYVCVRWLCSFFVCGYIGCFGTGLVLVFVGWRVLVCDLAVGKLFRYSINNLIYGVYTMTVRQLFHIVSCNMY